MRRAERRRAEREGQTPRTLREIDYLLMVDDEARMGALRFAKTEGGPFLAEYGPLTAENEGEAARTHAKKPLILSYFSYVQQRSSQGLTTE